MPRRARTGTRALRGVRRQRRAYPSPSGSAPTQLDQLLRNNERYAASFRDGRLTAAPRRAVAVVTCMDARLLPSRFLGLRVGDAHIISNAGGSAREALRSLVISQRLLGTREVAVVKHTDCRALAASNEEFQELVREDLGADASEVDFLAFSSLEEAVRDDVRFLASSPLIGRDVVVRGFIYDVKSGRMRELGAPTLTRS